MRFRCLLLVLSVALVALALGGLVGGSRLEPPEAELLAATAVERVPPAPPVTVPLTTYAPRPHRSPMVAPAAASPASRPGPFEDSVVARLAGTSVEVWHSIQDEHPTFALPSMTEWGNPRVLLASELRGDWVHVGLPLRPNGAEGWVRARDVQLSEVPDRIDVSLAERTLRWSRAGQVLLEATVGIGSAATPTPPGAFFVTDVLRADPAGGRGEWILALNGYSEALETYEGGLPRLAIHGTSNPASIGRALSAGCVRVDAFSLLLLAAGVPVGTPVTLS